jgi:outer membrane protein
MKRMWTCGMVAALGLGAALGASAAEGDLLVRGRVTYLDFDNGQNGMPAVVKADSRVIPEVDISYFFSDHFATELVLTYPQKVDISVNGADAGSVRALPPTLLAQYHFSSLGSFKPYLGGGVNLTLFSKRGLLAGAARTDKSSVGIAVQIGADFEMNEHWLLNVDLKYIDMDTGVHVSGSKIGTLDLNPIVASVGLGYRF